MPSVAWSQSRQDICTSEDHVQDEDYHGRGYFYYFCAGDFTKSYTLDIHHAKISL
jgi:hypothetical protein